MAVDTVKIRHLLGPTLKYEGGLIDVTASGMKPLLADVSLEYDVDGKLKVSDALQTLINRQSLTATMFDVRDHVVGGGALTRANFDGAFRAAVAACYAAYDNTGFAGFGVYVPAGNWELNAANGPVVFAGTYGSMGYVNQGWTPGIFGDGKSASVIFGTGSLAAGRGLIEFGVPGGDYLFGVVIQGVSIIHNTLEDGIGSGIRIREQSFVTRISDVYIRGWGGIQGPDDGIGLAFDAPSNPATQHQHVSLNDVSIQGCQTGLKRHSIAQYSDKQLHLTQNKFMSERHSKCLGGGTFGGTLQDSDTLSGARLSDTWFAGTLHPSTGGLADTLVTSGTGATLATAVSSTDPDTSNTIRHCTVTGLTGITRDHVGMWLCLSDGNSYGSSNLIRGEYQIAEYVSTTSVKVLKGTTHSLTAGLTWEIRTHQACSMSWEGFVYHEGVRRCVHHVGPCSPATTEQYVFRSVGAQNTMGLLVEGNTGAQVTADDVFYSGTKAARLNDCPDFRSNLDPSVYARNDYTRAKQWDRGRVNTRSRRFNSWVKEVGGFSFDATRADLITIPSSTNVSEWISAQDSAVKFTNNHATKYSTYVASDAGFNGPAISIPCGAVGANFQGLTCTIPNAKLPTEAYYATFIVVGRLPSTTPDADLRVLTCEAANGSVARYIGLNDGNFTATGIACSFYSTALGGQVAAQPSELVTATTNPFMIAASGSAEDNGVSGYVRAYSMSTNANYASSYQTHKFAPGVDMIIKLPWELNGTIDSFIVRAVAVVFHLVSHTEMELVRDFIANEHGFKR